MTDDDFAPRPGLSVVIPCYNEEAVLPELIRRLRAVCDAHFPDDHEILLVDDGSSDATWSLLRGYADSVPAITAVNLARNHGHQLALSAGLQLCTGNLVLVMDADLQDPPELLPQFIAKMAEGYDVVYGQRTRRAGETLFKRATASAFYRLLDRLVDVSIPRDTGDFRLMSRRVVDQFNAMPERFRFVRGMVSWIGFGQVALPYERDPRLAGQSHYPLRKMISFAIDAMTSFSTMPLRFASHLGLALGGLGIAALIWVIAAYAMGGTVAGWSSLAALILIMGSVQLLVLGILGEYLGRMYIESKQRPLFIVREIRRKAIARDNPVHALNDKLKQVING